MVDTEVTDPKLLAQLEGGGQSSSNQEVTDPHLLSQLNAVPVTPDAHHGVIERPGQPTPELMQQPPPPPPKPDPSFMQNFQAATPIAAQAAISAAGGPLGVAPLVAGGVARAAALAPIAAYKIAKGSGGTMGDMIKHVAEITGAGLILEHLPGGEKIAHIYHAVAGGGEGDH